MTSDVTERLPEEIDLGTFAAIVDLREGPAPESEIPGSIRIDRNDIDRIEQMARHTDAPILLYCGIGEASRVAARTLGGRGYTGIVSLLGGFRRWTAEERPVNVLVGRTVDRYDRHVRLNDLGTHGNERIRAAKALVIGAGGLGSPVIEYLAGAGVGTIGVVDGDRVSLSNLQRQVLFDESYVGMRKTDAAAERVHRLNSEVTVNRIATWLDADNAADLVAGYDILVDASDNFATRLAVNDAAWAAGVPFIHGAAIQWSGMIAGFNPQAGPCYRCVFPQIPEVEEACSDVGVLGAVTGVVGSLMAVETLKHLIGSPDRFIDRLVMYDGRSVTLTSLRIERSASCPLGHGVDVPSP